MMSGKVVPLARFIMAITSVFLLARGSVAPFCALTRREALAGELLRPGLLRSHWRRRWRKVGDRRSTALKVLATAALRSVNFFTGLKSSKGATPAKQRIRRI
jgi:hypothetical protein